MSQKSQEVGREQNSRRLDIVNGIKTKRSLTFDLYILPSQLVLNSFKDTHCRGGGGRISLRDTTHEKSLFFSFSLLLRPLWLAMYANIYPFTHDATEYGTWSEFKVGFPEFRTKISKVPSELTILWTSQPPLEAEVLSGGCPYPHPGALADINFNFSGVMCL